jgi:pantoate--beta-alanine ligase
MGALHDGHLSLIERARALADRVVVSIFVNPTQFAPTEDLATYPRDLAGDVQKAQSVGCHAFFVPQVPDLYPHGFGTYVVPESELTRRWEAASRPHFFRGVCTVVTKLLNIVQPDVAVFGQKDYQQLQVVSQMVRDLDLPVHIEAAPTHREPDGLAMSSRNQYLSATQRQTAAQLYQTLCDARSHVLHAPETDLRSLQTHMIEHLNALPEVHVDYVAFTDAQTLAPLSQFRGNVCLMLAAFVGNTRLIDNLLIQTP